MRLLSILLLLNSPALAQTPLPEAPSHTRHAAHVDSGEKHNDVAVFVGGTSSEERQRFTLGIDYERRLHKYLGVVGLIDVAFGNGTSAVAGAGLGIHPAGELRILLAPAAEITDHETVFVFRTGASYAIHIKNDLALAPTINFDVNREHTAVVYGFSLVKRF
ncbi:MAG: hypothetical protein HYX26_04070 [Acidobacteriales bacterium]|nr:hypothetical protein [Terriglobales bacterium]